MNDAQKVKELRAAIKRVLGAMNKTDTPEGCGPVRWNAAKMQARHALERTKGGQQDGTA